MREEPDRQLYNQLPFGTQVAIYTDFLFKEYLWKFRRHFSFRKESNKDYNFRSVLIRMRLQMKTQRELKNMSERNYENLEESNIPESKSLGIEFPFYNFRDQEYSKFMVKLMQNLEVKRISAGDTFVHELDECPEIVFVMDGKYDVGYQINNVKYFRRQFGHSTVIGGFQMAFNKKYIFHYKSRTVLSCYAIRRKAYKDLLNDFTVFEDCLKVKFFDNYLKQVYWPLIKLKNIDIEKFNVRDDYQ